MDISLENTIESMVYERNRMDTAEIRPPGSPALAGPIAPKRKWRLLPLKAAPP
ncbi:hypothetical protein [Xylophilus sp. ASV27]|uniref:hypothetical protein n=1 Tax=Xylophilus sp. ASV27 TaxID=2795129 RepID=UPI0018EB2B6B|nr:hypothetical protein [Xylophilus sp. ASV27]